MSRNHQSAAELHPEVIAPVQDMTPEPAAVSAESTVGAVMDGVSSAAPDGDAYRALIHVSALAIFRHLTNRLVVLSILEGGIGEIAAAVSGNVLKAPMIWSESSRPAALSDLVQIPIVSGTEGMRGALLADRGRPAYSEYQAQDLVSVTSAMAQALKRQFPDLREQDGDIQADLMTRTAQLAFLFTLSFRRALGTMGIDPSRHVTALSAGIVTIFAAPMTMARRAVISGAAFGSYGINLTTDGAVDVKALIASQKPVGRIEFPVMPEAILHWLGYVPRNYVWTTSRDGVTEYHGASQAPTAFPPLPDDLAKALTPVVDWFSRYPLRDGAADVLRTDSRGVFGGGDVPSVTINTPALAMAASFLAAVREVPVTDPVLTATNAWVKTEDGLSVANQWVIAMVTDRVIRDIQRMG